MIENNVAQTGTTLAQCCVTGHIGYLGVITIDAKSSDNIVVLIISTNLTTLNYFVGMWSLNTC